MRPKTVTPQAPRFDPVGARREPAWQQEVRERIRARRNKRVGAKDLPLFDGLALVEERPLEAEVIELPFPSVEPVEMLAPSVPVPAPSLAPADFADLDVPEPELSDLPLNEEEPVPTRIWPLRTRTGSPLTIDLPLPSVGVEASHLVKPAIAVHTDPAPNAETEVSAGKAAKWGERLAAGLVDTGLLASMIVAVAYFASRMAPVGLDMGAPGLWFLGFIGLLAGFYAGYFTGTTGQTPGKMLQRLRVVDKDGRAPGFVRALGRAVLGFTGVALCGVGAVPAAFDPDSRGFHDRVFRTRVVRQ